MTAVHRLLPPVPASEMAARTSADRDRVVDGVRAASLLIVVAGHCLMAVVAWPRGVPVIGNLLAAYPWTQLGTWVLQVMPLFFWAGGAANAISWARHHGRGVAWPAWVWSRAQRLLRPLWSYFAIMGVIAAVTSLFAPVAVADPLLLLTTQLLWFLGSYLLVSALTPFLIHLARRTPWSGAALLLVACGVIDLARFAWDAPEWIGLANFLLVWTVPAYLGTVRVFVNVTRRHRRFLVAGVVAALAANAALIAFGPYPVSMVGMPGDAVSNMAPPTLVLALHAVVLAGLVTLGDAALQGLLRRPAVWRRATAVNLVAMTLYLWHLPVLVAITTLAHALGLDRPTRLVQGFPVPDGLAYLVGSIPFALVFMGGVWLTVRLLWPLEHATLPWWDGVVRASSPAPAVATTVSILGASGVGVSALALSATGLAGFPTRIVTYAGLPLSAAGAILLMVASGAALRWAGGRRP